MFKMLTAAALCAACFITPAEARRHSRHGLPWCGIYLGQKLGMPSRHLWIARNWAREGYNAGGPAVGVVVVWRHHVGIIVGRTRSGEWVLNSGNDGGRVRTRVRSLAGAIAFRRV